MRFRHELSYDAAPAEVFAMLADPAFREASVAAQDVHSAEVALEPTATGFRLRVDQVQRTDDLPSFARAFAGDTTRAVQVEEWDSPEGGTLRIDAPGKPSQMSGTIRLEADGEGTREVVELDVRVTVPLVAGRLERLLVEKLRKGMDTEHQVGTAWLKGER